MLIGSFVVQFGSEEQYILEMYYTDNKLKMIPLKPVGWAQFLSRFSIVRNIRGFHSITRVKLLFTRRSMFFKLGRMNLLNPLPAS